MLTQIEIDGFKTFKGFKVELAPFQVIVGPNGSGKSNLFDAMHLLSRLADTDLRTAFQEVRGDADEIFTILPNGQHTNRIRMAIEMLVDRKVQDELGGKAELKYTRLRYEVEIILRADEYGLERMYVTYESLRAIPQDKDNWCQKYNLSFQNGWLPGITDNEVTFIDTDFSSVSSEHTSVGHLSTSPRINLYPDGPIREYRAQFQASDLQRTVLSSLTNTQYPHAFAAGHELRSLSFLHLNQEVLHQRSAVTALPFLTANGGNLPTTLARMQAEDKFALTDVSRDMASLVSGISKIRVEKNQASNEYEILAETSDQSSFSAQVLSDGTLRLLVFATLRNDPQFHGVLCLEEPENGVHPLHLKNLARVLRDMATDFRDPQQLNEPLRQVLITTHSPTFISFPEALDNLLFAHIVMRGGSVQGDSPVRVTRMVPVVTLKTQPQLEIDENRDKVIEVYTIDMVREYLSSDSLDSARNQLKKARMLSIEDRT